MLYLIGLGLWDEMDISLKGLYACKSSDTIYAELYTLKWGGSLEKLSEIAGKKIIEIPRSEMEENSGKIIKEAKTKTVSVLIPGDPLSATTHMHIFYEAKKQGIETKIVHSSSIFSAIAKTGLHLYKFGRTATVVRPSPAYAPDSFYDVAVQNRKSGLHTMMLLDIDMSAEEGAKILLEIEKKKKKKAFTPKAMIIACSRLGSESGAIVYRKAEDVAKMNLPEPAVIIIPGEMHFSEEEFIRNWIK